MIQERCAGGVARHHEAGEAGGGGVQGGEGDGDEVPGVGGHRAAGDVAIEGDLPDLGVAGTIRCNDIGGRAEIGISMYFSCVNGSLHLDRRVGSVHLARRVG
jgi:hypothetical protein